METWTEAAHNVPDSRAGGPPTRRADPLSASQVRWRQFLWALPVRRLATYTDGGPTSRGYAQRRARTKAQRQARRRNRKR